MTARARHGSGLAATRHQARHAGFTLIELIVVLAGLVALAALALPALLDRTGEAVFKQDSDRLVAAIAQARMQCLGDGRARRAVARQSGERWQIVVEPLPDATEERADAATPARVVFTLSEGLRFEAHQERARVGFVGPVLDDEPIESAGDAAPEAPPPEGWPIAVFGADGEAFPGIELALADRSGRRARLLIDAGARRVSLEAIAPMSRAMTVDEPQSPPGGSDGP